MLDKVIAIDFFAQFDKHNLLDGPTAMRYRRAVLEPGASKPAAELVKDFLGRPQNMDALKIWMNEEFPAPRSCNEASAKSYTDQVFRRAPDPNTTPHAGPAVQFIADDIPNAAYTRPCHCARNLRRQRLAREDRKLAPSPWPSTSAAPA